MYKIYINDNPLILTTEIGAKNYVEEGLFSIPWMGGKKQLLNYIDKLEKASDQQPVVISHPELDILKNDFWNLFKRVKAAGGVILNEFSEILFIRRLDRWDLPKGKRDRGEKNKDTALREVEEEVGLKCQIITKLTPTYHTYRLPNGKRILKKTTWYEMKPLIGEVKIQEEEHITEYRWLTAKDFLTISEPTYHTIIDLITPYIY